MLLTNPVQGTLVQGGCVIITMLVKVITKAGALSCIKQAARKARAGQTLLHVSREDPVLIR